MHKLARMGRVPGPRTTDDPVTSPSSSSALCRGSMQINDLQIAVTGPANRYGSSGEHQQVPAQGRDSAGVGSDVAPCDAVAPFSSLLRRQEPSNHRNKLGFRHSPSAAPPPSLDLCLRGHTRKNTPHPSQTPGPRRTSLMSIQALRSLVMVGLVPTIRKPLICIDPRHKAEDDDREAACLPAN